MRDGGVTVEVGAHARVDHTTNPKGRKDAAPAGEDRRDVSVFHELHASGHADRLIGGAGGVEEGKTEQVERRVEQLRYARRDQLRDGVCSLRCADAVRVVGGGGGSGMRAVGAGGADVGGDGFHESEGRCDGDSVADGEEKEGGGGVVK